MPAITPRTIRGRARTMTESSRESLAESLPTARWPRSALDGLGGQQALADLVHGDGQRLLLGVRRHQTPDILQKALAELRVVGVDLARPLRAHDHQAVPAV